MAPITHSLNKSLVPVDGKPALTRIVSQLDSSNIQRIVILTGHLSWQVEETVKLLSKTVHSDLVVIRSHPDFSPAQRLLESADLWTLGKELVLVYCDNLISDSTISNYLAEEKIDSVLVQKRSPGNVNVNKFGVIKYFEKRLSQLNLVELGYWRLDSQSFLGILKEEEDLPLALKSYTSKFDVILHKVEDYTSISSLEKYAKQRKNSRLTLFLDRDGVLVKSVGKGEYLKRTNEISFLDRNVDMLKSFSINYDIDYIVVTNQAGVERGIITEQEVEEVNQFIALKLLHAGLPIIAFYVCPHHWDSNCDCRKPKTGLLRKAIEDFGLECAQCLLIGDQKSDLEAGTSAGIKSFLIQENCDYFERIRIEEEIRSALKELQVLH